MRYTLVALAVALTLAGCVHSPWVSSGGTYTPESHDFDVELPLGWRHYNPLQSKDPTIARVLTRDGYALQVIRINKMSVDQELPHTKKKLSMGMLPQEAAEVVFDNIRSDTSSTNQQIVEQGPSTIGNRSGFRVLYSYQMKAGLKKQGLCYGVLVGPVYYSLIYEAPSRHYFSLDLSTFETLKDSFRIHNTTSGVLH
jgi:hypothetical protein